MRSKTRKKRSSIGYFSKSVFVLNTIAAVTLLLSYLAAFINPQTFWPFAFFGLAYPFLLLINVAFVVYWLFRKAKFALLSLAVILLGWKFVTGNIGFRGSTGIQVPKSSQNFIRVLTWNAHYFKKFDSENDKVIKDQMLDVIRNEQPDVLCIQEFYSRKKGEFNIRKSVLDILNTEHYYLENIMANDYEGIGLAIFSKYKIRNKGQIVFPNTDAGNQVIYSDFKVGNKSFRIYCVHLQSIKFQPEDYDYLKEVKQANANAESSKRIGSRLKNAFLKRAEQAKILRKHALDSGLPYLIAGDFNDTPASYTVNTLCKGIKNSFREKGSGFGVTYNGDFPNFQIDYILASNDFDVKNYCIIQKKLSDHYPIRSDVELK
ncbi:endonuclease/exonuclease/phosphatase family protein [Desertivirga brevis]|uniref:endonuclease/exonuclease/phosphatase family protein n=1 Tax=Desertivirga brevis TaxID=2810310 RepID=UPI001A958B90|nr:endonuclease/exonuclease/phosphatase family protein [Pedobacter sp. SYSU D00873]